MSISQSIFRAYDIRGVVGETLTLEVVRNVGLAIGTELEKRNQKKIIVARDGRLSSPELSEALIDGLMQSGRTVVDIGQVPTPLMYFATSTTDIKSGIMITGSHNPPEYNGIKMVIDGTTMVAEAIQNLYQRIISEDFYFGEGSLGKLAIVDEYNNYVANNINLNRPLKIVIDCGNSVVGSVAPEFFKKLGCEVIELFCEVDGNFPNHHPDPSVEKNMKDLMRTVIENNADVGLAFDGDGDRLGVVTNEGEMICADRQMMLFAKDVLSRNPGAMIIFDVKCSKNLAKVIHENNGEPLMWKTGHSYVKAKLLETGGLLAGEMSGHIFFKERWFGFDDALYVGARLLEILSNNDQSSSQIFKTFPDSVNTPELKLEISDEKKFQFMDDLCAKAEFENAEIFSIDGIRVEFNDGWGLVRASNTTPSLTFRFEAENEQALRRIQAKFSEEILKLDNSLELPF